MFAGRLPGKIIAKYCKPKGPDQLQHNTSRVPSGNTGGGGSMENSLSAGRKRLRRGTGMLLKEMRHNDALFSLPRGNAGAVRDCRGLGDHMQVPLGGGTTVYLTSFNNVKVHHLGPRTCNRFCMHHCSESMAKPIENMQ